MVKARVRMERNPLEQNRLALIANRNTVTRTRATPMKVGATDSVFEAPKMAKPPADIAFLGPAGVQNWGACPALIAFLRLVRASIPGHFLTVAAAVTRVLARGDGNAD